MALHMDAQADDRGVVLDVRMDREDEPEGIEHVRAEPICNGLFRLLLTPGLVSGFAAGDLVGYNADARSLTLVDRGGNVGVQFFHPRLQGHVLAHVEEQVKSVGGTVDGRLDRLLVFTFPVAVRVSNIQTFLQAYETTFGVEWEFANLFDADGEPLPWWEGYA